MVALAKPDNQIAQPQKSNEWYTPARYIEAAREVMGGIDLDPASCELANQTVKAKKFYTEQEDGLAQVWHGNVWLNPPFGRIGMRSKQASFAKELLRRYQIQEVSQAIALLFGPSLCMPWFVPFWQFPICIYSKHMYFNKPDGTTGLYGYGTIFVYLGPNEQRFIDTFSQFGRIAKAIDTPCKEVAPIQLWEVR